MQLIECVETCVNNKELVSEYNRLNGTSIGKKSTGINAFIDKACGYTFNQFEMLEFIDFVVKCVWMPLCENKSLTT